MGSLNGDRSLDFTFARMAARRQWTMLADGLSILAVVAGGGSVSGFPRDFPEISHKLDRRFTRGACHERVNPTRTMKSLLRLAYFAILYGLLSISSPAATGAPYFHIAGSHGETSDESLPLKSSAAKVEIDGTIARVPPHPALWKRRQRPDRGALCLSRVHPRRRAWHDAHQWRPRDRRPHPRVRQGEGGI